MSNPSKVSYASIDKRVASLDIRKVTASINEEDLLHRALTVYLAVRPLLFAFSALPLLPKQWRDAVSVFLTTLDHLVAVNPAFKMGKDL